MLETRGGVVQEHFISMIVLIVISSLFIEYLLSYYPLKFLGFDSGFLGDLLDYGFWSSFSCIWLLHILFLGSSCEF